MLTTTTTGKHTCNHLPGSRAEPGEGCRGRRLPAGQLGNSDDTHFRSVQHILQTKLSNSGADEHNVPNTPGVPGEELGLFSALTRGERVGCRGLMVKQSVRAPWVADLICQHSK